MTAVPIVGKLYSCREQSAMHGGNIQRTAPNRDGRITLLKKPGRNVVALALLLPWRTCNKNVKYL